MQRCCIPCDGLLNGLGHCHADGWTKMGVCCFGNIFYTSTEKMFRNHFSDPRPIDTAGSSYTPDTHKNPVGMWRGRTRSKTTMDGTIMRLPRRRGNKFQNEFEKTDGLDSSTVQFLKQVLAWSHKNNNNKRRRRFLPKFRSSRQSSKSLLEGSSSIRKIILATRWSSKRSSMTSTPSFQKKSRHRQSSNSSLLGSLSSSSSSIIRNDWTSKSSMSSSLMQKSPLSFRKRRCSFRRHQEAVRTIADVGVEWVHTQGCSGTALVPVEATNTRNPAKAPTMNNSKVELPAKEESSSTVKKLQVENDAFSTVSSREEMRSMIHIVLHSTCWMALLLGFLLPFVFADPTDKILLFCWVMCFFRMCRFEM